MRHFCTLFDKNYLYQALALYKSLEIYCNKFNLYALCMDDIAYSMIIKISKTGRTNLIPIFVSEIETDEVKSIKNRFSRFQYFAIWQPLICQYILDQYKVDLITYIDADIMFFNDPEILFKELNNYSVSVVPHHYTPEFDQTDVSGKFCVQFNAFRNDEKSREVLDYWKGCCFMYYKWMPSNLPGQLSLDYWPEKFECVRVIQHLGAGVAPWNIQQYEITNQNETIMVNGSPMVFYHFHEFAWGSDGRPFLSSYPLPDTAVKFIYQPYVVILMEIEGWVLSIDPTFVYKKMVRKTSLRENLMSRLLGRVSGFYGGKLREKMKVYSPS